MIVNMLTERRATWNQQWAFPDSECRQGGTDTGMRDDNVGLAHRFCELMFGNGFMSRDTETADVGITSLPENFGLARKDLAGGVSAAENHIHVQYRQTQQLD